LPALPNAVKVLKIVLRYVQMNADNDVINRFFMQYSGTAPIASELDTLANAIITAWTTDLAPMHSIDLELISAAIEDLTSPTSAVGSSNTTGTGSRTGAVVGAAVSAVMQEHINRRYRGGHPRAYLPAGVSADLQTMGTWTSAFQGNLTTAWSSFINDIGTAVWSGGGTLLPVNVSYYSGFVNHLFPSGRERAIPTVRSSPIIDVITSFTTNPRLGSQRRRNLQSS
jgi:hypothetical protein